MANFYTDNPDIQHCIDLLDMDSAVRRREGEDFAQAKQFEIAPSSLDEAKEQYAAVLELAGEISADFVAPRAEIVDREGNLYRDGEVVLHPELAASVQAFAEAGLMGLAIDRRYGGFNVPQVIKAAAIEMVSRGDASLMNIVGLQDIAETIEDFGDEEMKQEILPKMCSGEHTGAMVLTEPDAGSDLGSVRVRAELRDPDRGLWALSGVKRFITNGCGDVLLVLARSEKGTTDMRGLSVFLCLKGEGIHVSRTENKLGIHGSPTCEIEFTEAPARLLGRRRRGLIDVAMHIMNGARVGIAVQALGIAEAAERTARDYACTREQFGKPIRKFPAVYEMLAEMRIKIEAARALTYQAADVVEEMKMLEKHARDRKPEGAARKRHKELVRLANVLTPLCKYYASEMCNDVADDAIQVLGGSGYMKDYPVERHFRDSRITNIYEGTSQLQIVAAIGGILSGVFGRHLAAKLDEAEQTEARDLAAEFKSLAPLLDQSVSRVLEEKDSEFTELYSRPLVDIATDLYLGALLTIQAGRLGGRKRAVAAAFLDKAIPRVRGHADRIARGSRVLIDAHEPISSC